MDDRPPTSITSDVAGSDQSSDRAVAESKGRRWMVSIFGDITRSGSWPPGRRITPFALFGDVDLDLRLAKIPAGGVMISAVAPFGNIDVVVPQGAQVDVGGFTLFGSKKVAVVEPGEGGVAPLIRVRGVTLFGSFKVWSP
jgi:cell wall-active antibiotic response 4TMS protein YvqF